MRRKTLCNPRWRKIMAKKLKKDTPKEYEVSLTVFLTTQATVIVEAESENEAEDQVRTLYKNNELADEIGLDGDVTDFVLEGIEEV
jgi:hypothetical protein